MKDGFILHHAKVGSINSRLPSMLKNGISKNGRKMLLYPGRIDFESESESEILDEPPCKSY